MCGCLGDVEDSLRIIEESPMLKNLGDQTGRQKVDNVKAVVGVVDVAYRGQRSSNNSDKSNNTCFPDVKSISSCVMLISWISSPL